ncbi:helix-turn-helix domain-containing protein [Lutimonas zeaxanthinifaciens]|uniref:helix-turn-helix domain-containing protein n=1 Tax=Lutimonas zeaxanthinifaciens TaxID=3060215 RepID=UPI00265CA491|nr:helix-turn-helix domain-containing protein [Lutimonas sp. YSD2104]WKK67550.1 AraC family transcriptional regulator [Lutimonas sp. YSD2104]
MINLYSFIKESDSFRKMEVNDLLFVEYTCLQEETKFGIWSDSNYFAFITSGKKMWKSIYHEYIAEHGDILFIKKGANLTHQFFEDEFCAIFFFLPDDFIRSFMQKNSFLSDSKQKDLSSQDAVLRVNQDTILQGYESSIITYLQSSQNINEQLLTLKFEELLLHLCTDNKHSKLKDYFISLCQSRIYHMTRVMEENFAYHLKLEDYARLCHMSLSTFKKNFKDHYKTTPAVWLKNRKLDLALHRLVNSDLPIHQLSFECGFEDPSHFSRVFKLKHGKTPLQCRLDSSE